MFIPKITNSQTLRKRILRLSNFQIPQFVNAEKIIIETENSRKIKIAVISMNRKKRKLPKIFIPEITNVQNLRKRILRMLNFQILEISKFRF